MTRGQDGEILDQRHGDFLARRHAWHGRWPDREKQVDPVARLEHAGDGVDLVDLDGHGTDAVADPGREDTLANRIDQGRQQGLSAAHGLKQAQTRNLIEAIRGDRTAWRELCRHLANRHGVDIDHGSGRQVCLGHDQIDHLARRIQPFLLRGDPLRDIATGTACSQHAEGAGNQQQDETAIAQQLHGPGQPGAHCLVGATRGRISAHGQSPSETFRESVTRPRDGRSRR